MTHVQWSLQDAKNRFSSVVESARRGEPQIVTKRGIPAVVVLAAEEYARLQQLENLHQPSFKEHLLAMPVDDDEFARLDVMPREVHL
ncbi:MAG: type II toxin-antitoxin system Phd/YefM family antitoxin [Magnetococcales bacterium]|nr:type II toxin-antitoxin system Phd/YefM family antitoxin [Magnetococcales bacterium]